MSISFADQVAIVTGAGGGLGRCHALELARRGAKVVINDLGGAMDGSGGSSEAAEAVVAEIKAMGGEAIAIDLDVTNGEAITSAVAKTIETYGKIDILFNVNHYSLENKTEIFKINFIFNTKFTNRHEKNPCFMLKNVTNVINV